MLSPPVFWPGLAGLIALIAGLVSYRGEFSRARGFDKLLVLGPVFVAVGISVFGVVHFTRTSGVMRIVPAWMPAPLFWTYFVGVAQLCAALSFISKKYVWLSATLLGAMFFIFVLTIHLPNVALAPKDRIVWAVMFRDLSFAAGAWAISWQKPRGAPAVTARFAVGVAVLFFGVEQLLHPKFLPGVPLQQVTPAWVPLAPLWGYITGAALLGAGAATLMKKGSRTAVIAAGAIVTLVALLIDVPMLAIATQPEMADALNVLADTLLYAGALLCAATVLP